MNIFEENLSSQIISHSKTKRCMKIKIQWDKNNLNSMKIGFMNPKILIRFDNFLSYELKTLMRLLRQI